MLKENYFLWTKIWIIGTFSPALTDLEKHRKPRKMTSICKLFFFLVQVGFAKVKNQNKNSLKCHFQMPLYYHEYGFSLKYLSLQLASGKVLEETYKKWLQYKDDCLKAMSNKSVLPGMEKFQAICSELRPTSNSLFFFLTSWDFFFLFADLFCNRTFDRYACWPDSPAGSMVNLSCPFYLPWYDKGKS